MHSVKTVSKKKKKLYVYSIIQTNLAVRYDILLLKILYNFDVKRCSLILITSRLFFFFFSFTLGSTVDPEYACRRL